MEQNAVCGHMDGPLGQTVLAGSEMNGFGLRTRRKRAQGIPLKRSRNPFAAQLVDPFRRRIRTGRKGASQHKQGFHFFAAALDLQRISAYLIVLEPGQRIAEKPGYGALDVFPVFAHGGYPVVDHRVCNGRKVALQNTHRVDSHEPLQRIPPGRFEDTGAHH